MRHKFLVPTVKKWLKSVYIYGSYRKNKTGVALFGPLCRTKSVWFRGNKNWQSWCQKRNNIGSSQS